MLTEIDDSVEINTTIIAACIPTLRPVYMVMTGKSGAKVYTRKNKESCRIDPLPREGFRELREMNNVASRDLAHDGTEPSYDRLICRPESHRQTIDAEVVTNDSKYPSQNESTVTETSSIV